MACEKNMLTGSISLSRTRLLWGDPPAVGQLSTGGDEGEIGQGEGRINLTANKLS